MGLPIQITFDCHDVDAMAAFWATALDYQPQPPPDGFDSWEAMFEARNLPVPEQGSISAVVDPEGTGPRLLFPRVPAGAAISDIRLS